MWNILRTIKTGNYMYAVVPNHPKAIKHGYVLEHRVVMENHINRLLLENEEVHHINGNRCDNRIENLEIMLRGEHQRFHKLQYPEGHYVTLVCSGCGRNFKRVYRNRPEVKKTKSSYCSKECVDKFAHAPIGQLDRPQTF